MKARKFSTAGRVNGIVFDDRNGDGTYNGLADAYLAGWTVYADLDGDGTLDGNEPRAVSTNVTPDFFNHPPNYRLRGVPFGTPAALRLVPPGAPRAGFLPARRPSCRSRPTRRNRPRASRWAPTARRGSPAAPSGT